jgi:hypothetical protein
MGFVEKPLRLAIFSIRLVVFFSGYSWSPAVLLRARWPKCFRGFGYPAENLCLNLLPNSSFDVTSRSSWLVRHDICQTPLDAWEAVRQKLQSRRVAHRWRGKSVDENDAALAFASIVRSCNRVDNGPPNISLCTTKIYDVLIRHEAFQRGLQRFQKCIHPRPFCFRAIRVESLEEFDNIHSSRIYTEIEHIDGFCILYPDFGLL